MTPIDKMSVTFPKGTCGLIGPNGAGKTTFFNVLSGFVNPTGGTVRAFDEDLLAMADYRRARWGLRRTFQTEQAIEELSLLRQRRDGRGALPPINGGSSRTRGRARGRSGSSASATSIHTRRWGRSELASAAWSKSPARSSGTPRRPPRRARRRAPRRGDRAHGLGDPEDPDEIGALVILVDHDMNLVSACCELTSVLDFGKLIASGPHRRSPPRRAGRSRLPRVGGSVSPAAKKPAATEGVREEGREHRRREARRGEERRRASPSRAAGAPSSAMSPSGSSPVR